MNEARMWKKISLLLLLVLAVCAVVVIGIATMVLRNNEAQTYTGAVETSEVVIEQDVATGEGTDYAGDPVPDQTASSDTVASSEQEDTIPGETQVIYSAGNSSDGMISIDTKLCTLLFPKAWSDYLIVQETEVDGANIVTFYCSIGEDDVVLYNVYFNASDMGDPVGYITVDGEKIPCSVEYSDYVPEEWSEEQKDTFLSMAECINDVVDSIKANDGFSEE